MLCYSKFMSNSSTFRYGERTDELKRGYTKPLQTRLTEYKNANTPEKMMSSAEEIRNFGGSKATLLAAQAYMDIATNSDPADSLQTDAFSASRECADQSLRLSRSETYDSIRASKFILDLSLWGILCSTGKLPSSEKMEKHYYDSLDLFGKVEPYFKKRAFNLNEMMNFSGFLGEVATQLLINRYSLDTIGDGSMLALPSTLSQDRSKKTKGIYSGSWDVSVFTDTDRLGSPKLDYAIQVKTGEECKELYYDDISLLHFRRDLGVPGRRFDYDASSGLYLAKPIRVMRELINEIGEEPKDYMIDIINQRTERLLDVIDPPEQS